MKHNISLFPQAIIQMMMVVAISFTIIGCSTSDPENPVGGSIDSPEDLNASLNLLCTKWEESKDFVKGNASKGLVLVEEDDDFLKYTNNSRSFFISYGFNGGLTAAAIIVPVDETRSVKEFKPDGYSYLGDIDLSMVYSSADAKTMAVVLETYVDGQKYITTGLSPFESTLFEEIEPLVVTTGDATGITTSSMTLNCSYSGVAENPVAYIIYSFNPDLSNAKTNKCSITDGKFSRSVTGIPANSTVYYKARVVDDGIVYEGNIEKAMVEKLPVYAVGDPYPDATNPIGIVYSVKNEGTAGYIISLDQSTLQWDVNYLSQDRDATNTAKGENNNMGNASPFGSWVKNHGTGWFGPAKNQLDVSLTDIKKINAGLRAHGGVDMNGFYWTSTQSGSSLAWVTTICESTYLGYSRNYKFKNSKTEKRSCRAMKAF